MDKEQVISVTTRMFELVCGVSFKGEDAEKIAEIKQLARAMISQMSQPEAVQSPADPGKPNDDGTTT